MSCYCTGQCQKYPFTCDGQVPVELPIRPMSAFLRFDPDHDRELAAEIAERAAMWGMEP